MLWFDRRQVLSALAAGITLLATLSACGFTPVYGPDGAGNQVLGQIAFSAPETVNEYSYTKRLEERMGRSSGPYHLDSTLSVSEQSLGNTSSGETTRIRLNGIVSYSLTTVSDDSVVMSGSSRAFTSYSFTGSTAATQAAERDAHERLMIILADQVIDNLLLQADTLTGAQ